MLNLLIKDFKLLFASNKSFKSKLFSGIIKLLMLSCFIGFETFLFVMILNKVNKYPDAPQSFLILFLFVISIIMVILNLLTANKIFFNEEDNELSHYPVSNEEIILSKLVFLFAIHYFTSILVVYPILISYGVMMTRTPWYYFMGLFYPVLSFFLEAGVALILVYPFKLIIDYLKKHILLQFFISSVILITGCYLYSKLLEVFMALVLSNNLNSLFTTASLDALKNATNYMLPIAMLVKSYLGISKIMFPYISISIGVFILGLIVAVFTFNRLRTIRFNSKIKEKKRKLKIKSLNRSLIDKELALLFKDSSNIFSFSGLLLIEPILMYLVVDALNGVFSSGAFQYYMLALPYFIPLMDVVLVMLFTIIINSGSNNYISNELKTMKIMKTIPVHYGKQLLYKALVPYMLSVVSLLVSEIVLISTKTIGIEVFIFSFILSAILLALFELVSLNEELKIRINKPRNSFISSLYSYLIPLGFFVIALFLTNLGLKAYIAYLIGILLIILLALPYVIHLKQKVTNQFMDLEVVN